MVGGLMSGLMLGQQLVEMSKSQRGGGRGKNFFNLSCSGLNSNVNRPANYSSNQRLQSAKLAAYKRMKAHQANENFSLMQAATTKNFSQPGRGNGKRNFSSNIAEEIVFEEGFTSEFKRQFKDDASGELLNSIRRTLKEFNDFVKQKTGGLLDLNMSLAIFFIIRGIRRIVLEKQYPNAWQMIWWATSILRGWRLL